jgi:hypothetical protein
VARAVRRSDNQTDYVFGQVHDFVKPRWQDEREDPTSSQMKVYVRSCIENLKTKKRPIGRREGTGGNVAVSSAYRDVRLAVVALAKFCELWRQICW